MTAEFDVRYQALRSRDRRFDGRFFVAVTGRSTAPKDITDIAEQWRPWRAYALQHLWATYPLGRKL